MLIFILLLYYFLAANSFPSPNSCFSLQVLQSLVTSTFQTTLNFLSQHTQCSLLGTMDRHTVQRSTIAMGMREIPAFLSILTALLNRYFSRDQHEQEQQQQQTEGRDCKRVDPGRLKGGWKCRSRKSCGAYVTYRRGIKNTGVDLGSPRWEEGFDHVFFLNRDRLKNLKWFCITYRKGIRMEGVDPERGSIKLVIGRGRGAKWCM